MDSSFSCSFFHGKISSANYNHQRRRERENFSYYLKHYDLNSLWLLHKLALMAYFESEKEKLAPLGPCWTRSNPKKWVSHRMGFEIISLIHPATTRLRGNFPLFCTWFIAASFMCQNEEELFYGKQSDIVGVDGGCKGVSIFSWY